MVATQDKITRPHLAIRVADVISRHLIERLRKRVLVRLLETLRAGRHREGLRLGDVDPRLVVQLARGSASHCVAPSEKNHFERRARSVRYDAHRRATSLDGRCCSSRRSASYSHLGNRLCCKPIHSPPPPLPSTSREMFYPPAAILHRTLKDGDDLTRRSQM